MTPQPVARATDAARRAGFTAVPAGGRILELGTGAGVGTAWITHGVADRTDVEVVTVDLEPGVAAGLPWPPFVRLVEGDAVEVTAREGTFDLIFADARGGKWHGLDVTVAALRPGGHLLVDDMTPPAFADAHHERKTAEVRAALLGHPGLVSVEIAWSTGLVLSTRRSATPDELRLSTT